jgi:uncharacterized protein YerC
MDLESVVVQIARMMAEGRSEDMVMLTRQTLRKIGQGRPDLANDISQVLAAVSNGLTRKASDSPVLPYDLDSRLELLRHEDSPALDVEPTWPTEVASQLNAVLAERRRVDELINAQLVPTRSLLFIGPPGVGKTMAAKWIARQLGRPLLTLDLAAVMSSFLGKTGNNIRTVLDYARRKQSVLLLDEFDAIAKRRDDIAEVGELKRLVTVLIQAVDEWPADSLLIAATNHPELLDPAIWRRFDRLISFPLPRPQEVVKMLKMLLRSDGSAAFESRLQLLSMLLEGSSFAEISREVLRIRRQSVLDGSSQGEALLKYAGEISRAAPLEKRIAVAAELIKSGETQRNISALTGLSRDTIRKHLGATVRVASQRG